MVSRQSRKQSARLENKQNPQRAATVGAYLLDCGLSAPGALALSRRKLGSAHSPERYCAGQYVPQASHQRIPGSWGAPSRKCISLAVHLLPAAAALRRIRNRQAGNCRRVRNARSDTKSGRPVLARSAGGHRIRHIHGLPDRAWAAGQLALWSRRPQPCLECKALAT